MKVWLQGISPMIWRRLLVPTNCTLRELHGVIQVAMGWDGIHLYHFRLRSRSYGSVELCASSPDIALAALKLRRGARFAYEYDLNIPWRHEVRIEAYPPLEFSKTLPRCMAGSGACPPEDCGGPAGYMAGLEETWSTDAIDDMATLAEILRQVVLEGHHEMLDDEETRYELERALERGKARQLAQGQPFVRRAINTRLRKKEHLVLMHQQW